MLKVELHAHTSDDPEDYIAHSTEQLIDRMADLGYDALAITLHDKQIDLAPFEAHARQRNVVLIPGVERTLDGRHLLLINFTERAARVHSFEEVAALKAEEPNGLVVAPHPFFPLGNCLGELMDRYADLYDAVEVSALYARALDFNDRAIRWARAHDTPTVGNGDVHWIEQLGRTYSLVDAEPTPDAICAAIRAGRVRVETRPFGFVGLLWVLARLFPGGLIRRLSGKRRTRP